MVNYRTRKIAIVLAAIIWPIISQSEVYRCSDDGDPIQFSDQPCGKNAQVLGKINNSAKHEYGFQRYLRNSRQAATPSPTPAPPAPRPTTTTPAPNINVSVTPNVNCPSDETINQAISRRTIVACMTMAQAKRAIPPGITGFNEFHNFDQFGSFTEWRFPVVTSNFPVRIQFREGQVFGFETLPLRRRD